MTRDTRMHPTPPPTRPPGWASKPDEVLICSTGIIGVELPVALIRTGIGRIELSEEGGHALARAILTTDTRPKVGAVSFQVDGKTVHIGGVANGGGHDPP